MAGLQEASKAFDLEMAYNVRDLGVYINEGGTKLQEKQILRADGLHSLSESDRKYLKTFGIKAVIDLRSQAEINQKPCVFCNEKDLDYYSIPLVDHIQSDQMAGQFPKSLSALYIDLLENSKPELSEVLRIIGRYSKGCVIFNCTAGKDRTGVVAMLLLGLAGVRKDTIVSDYAASAENIRPLFLEQKKQMELIGFEIPSFVLESYPEDMEATLDFIIQRYGSVTQYIHELSLTPAEIESIQRKLGGI